MRKIPPRPTRGQWEMVHYGTYYGSYSICPVGEILSFQRTRVEDDVTCDECIRLLPEHKKKEGNY